VLKAASRVGMNQICALWVPSGQPDRGGWSGWTDKIFRVGWLELLLRWSPAGPACVAGQTSG